MAGPPIDRSLLESPYDDANPRRGGRHLLWIAFVVTAAAAFVVFAATRPTDAPPDASATTTTQRVDGTPVLVPHVGEPAGKA